MTEKLNLDSNINAPKLYLDGDLYPLSWNSHNLPATESPDVSGLPSFDYVLYLFNIVKYRLGITYRLLDDGVFVCHLQDFYGSQAGNKVIKSRFWFVQYLLVLALGTAFLARPRKQACPPGSKFFTRAMAAMPSYTSTGKDTLLAIETLGLAGVYLYAVDHRESAHVHVSKHRLSIGYTLLTRYLK